MRPSFIMQLMMIQSRDGDWGWQTDTRSHNSGYKNRDLCWLIVMSEYHHLTPGNSIIMQHSCLGHYCIAAACRTEDTLVLSVSDVGDHWLCPRVWPPLTGCLGVGARVWCIRVLPSTQPSQSALARPGPLTLHTEQTSWVSPVTEDREDTDIRHMNTGQWKERGIPREYLPTFCISVFY